MSHEQYEPPRHLRFDEHPLYVIAVCSNPKRYASRYRLFREFQARMRANPEVVLVSVEQAFGERPFEVTHRENQNDVQVRSESEVWVKESLVNIGFRHLTREHPQWEYATWIDGDIEFLRPDWARQTIHALQHHRIVQPWSHCIDQGPNHTPIGHGQSFCKSYVEQEGLIAAGHDIARAYTGRRINGVDTWHPGYAWGIRRETWQKLGRLMDWCLMGSADHHMAWSFIGLGHRAIHPDVTDGYRRKVAAFQQRCLQHVEMDIGYVEGTIAHWWHGKKRQRFYVERRKTLNDLRFDPETDVDYDHEGVLTLAGNKPLLRDACRRYLGSRNEDSIDE